MLPYLPLINTGSHAVGNKGGYEETTAVLPNADNVSAAVKPKSKSVQLTDFIPTFIQLTGASSVCNTCEFAEYAFSE